MHAAVGILLSAQVRSVPLLSVPSRVCSVWSAVQDLKSDADWPGLCVSKCAGVHAWQSSCKAACMPVCSLIFKASQHHLVLSHIHNHHAAIDCHFK